jgi:hypothetical protein
MPELSFAVEKAEPVPYSAAPLLNFSLRIANTEVEPGGEPQTIHAIALRCQIRIEPARRRYEPVEQERLLDLYGEPSRWGQTLRTMLWTHTSMVVPSFSGSTVVELPVPCTYDFNLAATKYFYALENDEVPLCLLFSGTIFYAAEGDALQIAQIPWEREATFRLPVRVWKQMMEIYYPNTAWLNLRQDTFDALYQYKSRRGLLSWEAAIEKLLAASDEQVPT